MREKTKIINSSIIALIVLLYDEKNELGISKCIIDNSDLLIKSNLDIDRLDYANTLDALKFITVRKLIEMNFEDYLERIRLEFSGNIGEDDKLYILGKQLITPMTSDEIEYGIELGLILSHNNFTKM